jgi:hypothetical protein
MNLEIASMTRVHPHPNRALRADSGACALPGSPSGWWAILAVLVLALVFVVAGAGGLDLGPQEARVGLAAGERIGPVGQVLGYWAPDLWPAQVLPSLALTRLTPSGRPTTGVVRWPAALAAVCAGWLLVRGIGRTFGSRAAIVLGFCWFSSLAMIDRSAGAGIDPILGLATLAAIERILSRGSDWIAGLWASLAFLAGGWPPLAAIALVLLVIGRRGSSFSHRLLLPPMVTAIAWSATTIGMTSAELWAAALTLPLTRRPDWGLAPGVLLFLGMPWSPFVLLAWSRSIREAWPIEGRAWVTGWLQAAIASLIAGSLVPGLDPSARILALAGLLVGASACLESVWRNALGPAARRSFFSMFSLVLTAWLVVMIYGCFIWILTMSYYRTLGITMALLIPIVVALGWSALGMGNSRRALVTLMVLAIGLKLAHWGYYVPEWNYRRSQGPWGRAIGQWIPRKWSLYILHDWPDDLSFFIGRPVRQLRSPRFLNYLPGSESRYVLLQTQEFENWPDHAPPVSVVARFHDPSGAERILARTAGFLPVPGLSTMKYSP